MRPKIVSICFLLLFLTGIFANSSQAFMIDDFTSVDPDPVATGFVPPFSHSANGWTAYADWIVLAVTVSEEGLTDVPGGTRFTSGWWSTGGSNYAGIDTIRSRLTLSNSSYNRYGRISTFYDAGGAGLNLDFSNEALIRVNFSATHLASDKNSIMEITLTDANNASATQTKIWDTPTGLVVEMDVAFPLSGFTGIDISSIKSLEFFYEGDSGGRDYFYSIQTIVPIPGAAWLLGSGLIGLVCIRKRVCKL